MRDAKYLRVRSNLRHLGGYFIFLIYVIGLRRIYIGMYFYLVYGIEQERIYKYVCVYLILLLYAFICMRVNALHTNGAFAYIRFQCAVLICDSVFNENIVFLRCAMSRVYIYVGANEM